MVIDYSLIESGFGTLENQSVDKSVVWTQEWCQEHFAETDAAISARVKTFLDRVKILHPDDTILVVTHGAPMKGILKWLGSLEDKSLSPANATFRILTQ